MSSVPTVDIQPQQSSARPPTLERRLFVLLSIVALAYAFFAGLRTVSDFDLGWQMATGRLGRPASSSPEDRCAVVHHAGQPWNYPIGSAVIFYLAYVIGGFALISWIGTAACVGAIALLLRRNTAAGAAIAILAVPLIAQRTTPRADMFSIVLFAAYLSLLWENYQTGKARLWLLPVLMVAWANLHFGFASGLALIVAYVFAELLELLFGEERRRIAIDKLRRAWPWLAATFAATRIIWGWNIYHGLLVEQRAYEQGRCGSTSGRRCRSTGQRSVTRFSFATWSAPSISCSAPHSSLELTQLFRGQWATALLLLGATDSRDSTRPHGRGVCLRRGHCRRCSAVVADPRRSCALRPIRIYLVGDRRRHRRVRRPADCDSLLRFGYQSRLPLRRLRHRSSPGLCSWFPARAAEFLRRENPPGEILNTYAAGGFLSWSLGPERHVYIDGRDTLYGPPHLARLTELEFGSLDSAAWQEEVSKYNINTVVLALTQYDGVPPALLFHLCNSKTWSPVYLDELSAVFVRRTPANHAFIERFPVNCAIASLPAPPANSVAVKTSTPGRMPGSRSPRCRATRKPRRRSRKRWPSIRTLRRFIARMATCSLLWAGWMNRSRSI